MFSNLPRCPAQSEGDFPGEMAQNPPAQPVRVLAAPALTQHFQVQDTKNCVLESSSLPVNSEGDYPGELVQKPTSTASTRLAGAGANTAFPGQRYEEHCSRISLASQ